MVLLYPTDNLDQIRKSNYLIKHARPMPDSRILAFTEALKKCNFDQILIETDAGKADKLLLSIMMNTLDQCIPVKTVKLRQTDKNFFTNELKDIDRKKKREYSKNEKSEKFYKLK